MTDKTKNLLKERSKLARYFYRNGQVVSDGDKVSEKSTECPKNLLDYNKSLYNKKVPVILPLLVGGNFVSDFNKEVNFFNNLFASICPPIKKASTLPYFPKEQQNKFFSCY